MSTLELNFIGVPEVVLDGRHVTFRRRASIGLLAYLVYSGTSVTRELLLSARRLIAEEPWLEEAHYALMQLLGRAGQRQAAMAQHQACRRVLLEELLSTLLTDPTSRLPRMQLLHERGLVCATMDRASVKLHPLLQRYLGSENSRRSMVALAA